MGEVLGYKPEMTRCGVLDCQVCVPAEWTDAQIEAFANSKYLCGTSGGWQIRKEGDKLLAGSPERVPCEEREGMIHVALDA